MINGNVNTAQAILDEWTRNANCVNLHSEFEYAYALEISGLLSNPGPDAERYFYHSDHLGSSAFVTTEMRSIREDLQNA